MLNAKCAVVCFFKKIPGKIPGINKSVWVQTFRKIFKFYHSSSPLFFDNNIINLFDNNLIKYFNFARIFFNFDCYLELKKIKDQSPGEL